MTFRIDVFDSSDNKLGSGPISTAEFFEFTMSLDRSGNFAFAMPATDGKASLIQKKRIVKAFALLGNAWIPVGAGIIDRIERTPAGDGTVTLHVSGSDLLRELTYRTVRNLKLYDNGLPVTHAAALTATLAYAPPGWTFTPDASPPNPLIYGQFNNNSVLDAIIKISEKSYDHFTGGIDRTVTFASSFTPSGIRAIQARGDLSPATCAITDLQIIEDTFSMVNRVYARGSGNADVQLTLRATNRVAPSGYVLDTTEGYIENMASVATYGRIEQVVDYREIGPISNTDADVQAASNALFDAALEELRRRSVEIEQATYQIAVAQCSALLRPMQTIRAVYRDLSAGIDVNADLNVLESTWRTDSSGVQTTRLVVSTSDRLPQSDVNTLVDNIAGNGIYQALPQLNANSYVTAYNKLVDETEIAAFRFRFGSEVTQLQQVLFEFQLLPLESSVKAVGGASSGSGDIPTSTPSTPDTGSGGNNETGSGGSVATGSGGAAATEAGGNNTDAGGSVATGSGGTAATDLKTLTANVAGPTGTDANLTGVTGGTELGTNNGGSGDTFYGGSGDTVATGAGNTGSASGDTGAASGNTGAASGNTGAASGNTGSTGLNTDGPAFNTTGSPSSDATGAPTGGDIVSAGQHRHDIGVFDQSLSGSAAAVYIDVAGSDWFFVAASGDNRQLVDAALSDGNHTHSLGAHTHTLNSHTHTLSNHTHSVGSHAHTLNSHVHTLNSHVHTLNSHTHSLGGHTHSIGVHTHIVAAHTHFVAGHNHSISSHTHTLDSHTHTINQHTHTITAHTHSIATHTHGITTHTHTIATHTHTIATHTHSMAQHTHTLNNHTHDLSESIVAIYGIFRESALNTFALADLEYRVNSGTWFSLDTATDVSSGWNQLDITSLVQDATTFRPLQTNNLLEIRRKTSGALNKTAQLDAHLNVRNIIQAIAYA